MNKSLLIAIFLILKLCTASKCQVTCFVSVSPGYLYKLNPMTCDTQLVGYSLDFTDLAITPSGVLYGIDGYKLYRVDSSNASSVFIGDIGTPLVEYFNSLIAISDEYLIGVNNLMEFVKIRTSDGAKIVIDSSGYFPAGDLTYYRGSFYLSAIGNELVKIDFNDDFTKVKSTKLVGVMNTESENVYGIITVGQQDCAEGSSRMYAFEYDKLYEIDASTANVTLVCDSLYLGVALGAASMIESLSQYSNNSPIFPNVFSPNNDGVNDVWKPSINIFSQIHFEIYNRWGQLLFETNGPNIGWDGEGPNGPVAEGVYYYILNYKALCSDHSGPITYKGTVHLVR